MFNRRNGHGLLYGLGAAGFIAIAATAGAYFIFRKSPTMKLAKREAKRMARNVTHAKVTHRSNAKSNHSNGHATHARHA